MDVIHNTLPPQNQLSSGSGFKTPGRAFLSYSTAGSIGLSFYLDRNARAVKLIALVIAFVGVWGVGYYLQENPDAVANPFMTEGLIMLSFMAMLGSFLLINLRDLFFIRSMVREYNLNMMEASDHKAEVNYT